MKVIVDILRATKIKVNDLLAILGDEPNQNSMKEINSHLVESFGPLANGFKILWSGDENTAPVGQEVIVGIEVIQFRMDDVCNVVSSESLFHHVDKLTDKEINRVDGALFSELNRLGIYNAPELYSFKAIMKVEGN